MVNPLSAAQYGDFTYTDNGTFITITDCPQHTSGDVVIPAAIIGKPVTSIGDFAFVNCEYISITIPATVTNIGWRAFAQMASWGGCRMYFMGNAPTMGQEVFYHSSVTAYYLYGKTGFGPNWQGLNCLVRVPPEFANAPLPPSGAVGSPYSYTLAATGTPRPTFSVTSGALPDGLFLSSAGEIFGTPTVEGIFTATITATNGIPSDSSPFEATQTFSIEIREYRALVLGGSNGTISGAGSYLLNTTATLTATPFPGYAFNGWSGDATGTVNPLSVLMDSDKTITANFIPDTNDADADGLTNYQEIMVYGTNPNLQDTDADGFNDGEEVNYAGSYFKIVQGAFTYPQAVADAAAKGGRVASFPNADDYTRAAHDARQTTQGYLWIGLSDATTENTWVWTDGTTATYSRWLTGEPSGGAAENHVVIMENSTKWADTAESYVAAGYIFERVGLDPLDPDTDADGLTDGQEINTTHSSPVLDDTDGDGLLDGAEVNTHGSSPLLADTDTDGINDRVEVEVYHSNPALKDSDGDGFDDLFEVNTGFNPTLATSTPDALSTIRTAVEFRFNAANGVSYRIEASTDLQNWNTIETDIIGESAVVTRFYTTENMPKRYFRVRRN